MKKRPLLISFLAGVAFASLIFVVSGYRHRSSQTTTNQNSQAASEHAGHSEDTYNNDITVRTDQVSYEDSGFKPAVIEVQQGATVTFTNHSSQPMQVASGPHPTHDAYPEFNSAQALAPGQSYRFTFLKVGTWSYHNHLNETYTGLVIVDN